MRRKESVSRMRNSFKIFTKWSWIKKVKDSHSQDVEGKRGYRPTVSWAHPIKFRAHSSPFGCFNPRFENGTHLMLVGKANLVSATEHLYHKAVSAIQMNGSTGECSEQQLK